MMKKAIAERKFTDNKIKYLYTSIWFILLNINASL